MNQTKKKIKQFWDWVWNSESPWSYVVLILMIFIVVKFIIFPVLGFIFQSSLPLAIVESESMDHRVLKDNIGEYKLCGVNFGSKRRIDFNEYWDTCGSWYEVNTEINKEDFQKFKFSNGMRKGDLIIISGWRHIEKGDVIVFASPNHPHPLIHRVISLDPLQTKGDHNSDQLLVEKNISQEQVIGIAVGRVPYIGLPKVWLCEAVPIPGLC